MINRNDEARARPVAHTQNVCDVIACKLCWLTRKEMVCIEKKERKKRKMRKKKSLQ